MLHDTFYQACIALNLLSDDSQWVHTMEEAAVFRMPSQLRFLFATLCAHCGVQRPLELWERFKAAMCEDYLRSYSGEDSESMAMTDIQMILAQSGIKCTDLGLPEPTDVTPHTNSVDLLQKCAFANESIAKLNPEQQRLVDAVFSALRAIDDGSPPTAHALFLDGPGGSGKTMVYNTLVSPFIVRHKRVAACAWTGIAATLLRGGQTVHSLFKLPVPITDTSTCAIQPSSRQAQLLRDLSLIVIDEASMVPPHALRAIDICLRDITSVDVPFGGKIILLGGDFRQVLPVVPHGTRSSIVENCLKRSPLWCHFETVHLIRNMRAKENEVEFAQWLLQLGNGTLNSLDMVDILAQCTLTDDIVSSVYPDAAADIQDRVILTPKNDVTLQLNDAILKTVPSEPRTFLSDDSVVFDVDAEAACYPLQFLNSLTPSGMPPHHLTLKPGCIIMLLHNLDVRNGICNGTRLIVKHLHNHSIDAEVISSSQSGKRVLIPRIKLAPNDVNLPFILQRRQFPIRLAYSMTINKAQGQTFGTVGIFLPEHVFSHGQLYVAFSRARSFQDIHVCITYATDHLHPSTGNIVFRDVL